MLIDGRQIATELKQALQKKLATLPPKRVCFVMFQKTFAIEQFVGIKTRVGEELGLTCVLKPYDDVLDTEHAVSYIKSLATEGFDGVVVQLPLPAGLETTAVLNAVPAEMDIDGLGYLATRLPPVALVVKTILERYNIQTIGKNIVILGQGRLVGQPVERYFRTANIPCTVLGSEINDEYLARLKTADIVITGIGQPNFIKPEMIKLGVVIIDAGTSEQNGKVAGDVDPACADIASYMTPVPGGVGPIAVACLYGNLLN